MAPGQPGSNDPSARHDLASFFGALEGRVLDALWKRDAPVSVRDLQADFPEAAYTTLMTTLDRLHRKGVLDRVKAGRAFLYRPRYTSEELRARLASDTLRRLLGADQAAIEPIVSFFVEAVSRQDREVLDNLEQLVQAHRRQVGDRE
jgi:predicted transcriptional regulator